MQPTGPYRLAGYSFGAGIALEMALQLEKTEGGVASMVLLDGSHSFVSAYSDRTKQWMGLTDDAPGSETMVIRIYMRQRLGVPDDDKVRVVTARQVMPLPNHKTA